MFYIWRTTADHREGCLTLDSDGNVSGEVTQEYSEAAEFSATAVTTHWQSGDKIYAWDQLPRNNSWVPENTGGSYPRYELRTIKARIVVGMRPSDNTHRNFLSRDGVLRGLHSAELFPSFVQAQRALDAVRSRGELPGTTGSAHTHVPVALREVARSMLGLSIDADPTVRCSYGYVVTSVTSSAMHIFYGVNTDGVLGVTDVVESAIGFRTLPDAEYVAETLTQHGPRHAWWQVLYRVGGPLSYFVPVAAASLPSDAAHTVGLTWTAASRLPVGAIVYTHQPRDEYRVVGTYHDVVFVISSARYAELRRDAAESLSLSADRFVRVLPYSMLSVPAVAATDADPAVGHRRHISLE